ncbi:hypothetical protein KUTeg_006541 [Tegillarca granosa]|uniref:Uncharacterized protein n=1 Tax=Tegillarca granosa TaxID=220873 RepID=A0ABQ9FEZ0_TEGGR|nr:hypothetical protein KUTeg_006541 [Tegillarca granosa]
MASSSSDEGFPTSNDFLDCHASADEPDPYVDSSSDENIDCDILGTKSSECKNHVKEAIYNDSNDTDNSAPEHFDPLADDKT